MKFRIKLLSGNNIILAEAENYEAEIFMPCIVKGRINFMNVIPERRCCRANNGDAVGQDKQGYTTIACPCQSCGSEGGTGVGRVGFADDVDGNKRRRKKKGGWEPYGCDGNEGGPPFGCVSMPRAGRHSAGSENRYKPQEGATMTSPAVMNRNLGTSKKKPGTSKSSSMKGDSTLPTPDLPRRAAPLSRNDVIADDALLKHRRAVKLRALYPASPVTTPSKSYRLPSATYGGSGPQGELHNVSPMTDLSNSFGKVLSQSKGIISSTPINKRLDGGNQESAVNWRKCLTPRMTYSRRGNHAIPTHDKTFSPTRMPAKPPSFLANPTVPPKPTHRVELKKRRLKVDDQVRIPTRVIKKRHLKSKNLGVSVSNLEYIKSSLKHLSRTPISAFDMLTNSNRSRCISNKLNQQFRKGCVNKASSTHSKYRVLSSVPPLKEDGQTQQLTQITEPSFKKPVEQISKNKSRDQVAAPFLVNKATSTMPLGERKNNSAGVIFYKSKTEPHRMK